MPDNDLFGYDVSAQNKLPGAVSLDVKEMPSTQADVYKEYQKAIGSELVPHDQAVLQEMAHESHWRSGLIVKGIVRGATKVLEETLNIPGYAAVPFTGWDNTWLQTIKGGAEAFRNVAAPVYMSKAVEEGGIGGKLLDGAWWATTGADGIGFMAAMFVPGAALKALGAGRLLTGAAGTIGRGAEILGGTAVTAADLTNVGNKITGLGRLAKWGKGIQASAAATDIATSGMTVAANTYIEAAAEANSSYLNTRDKLMRDNPNMTAQEAERIAGDAAANVFGANLGILGISNYIIERYVFKGFNARASAVNRLKGVNPFAQAAEGAAERGVRGAAKGAAEVGEEVVQAGERAAVKGVVGEGAEAAEKAGVRAAGEVAEEGVEEGVSAGLKGARRSSKTGKTLADVTAQSFWKKAGRATVGGAKGAAVEGGWEEGMQTSAEQYFVNEALRGGDLSQPWNIPGNLLNIAGKWIQNVSEMESTPESREFYEAATLGGILGGGMTTVGDYSGIGDEERILFGTPEVKAREKFMGSKRLAKGMDRLTNRKPRAATPGLIDEFKSKIEASTIKLEDILIPKADGTGYETNEDGTYAIDENKLGAISEAGKDLAISMAQLAAYEQALGDKKTDGTITMDEKQELEKLKHRREMFLLNQYINTEGGAELFDSHAEEIVDKFIEKRFEDSPVPLKPEERVMEIQRLKGKVKRLSKLNEVIRNTHVDNMSVLMQEPGTPEDKQLFSNLRLNQKASQGAYLDNLEQQIKELERRRERVQTIDGESTINREEAKALNAEIELLEKEKQKAQEVYQDMFNRDKIKQQYNTFLERNKLIEDLQKNMEEKKKRVLQPDYVKELFNEKGHDYDSFVGEINFTVSEINEFTGELTKDKFSIERNPRGGYIISQILQPGDIVFIEETQTEEEVNAPTKYYITEVNIEFGNFVITYSKNKPLFTKNAHLLFRDISKKIEIENANEKKQREDIDLLTTRREKIEEEKKNLIAAMKELEKAAKEELQQEIERMSEQEKIINAEKLLQEAQEQLKEKENTLRLMKSNLLSKVAFNTKIKEFEDAIQKIRLLIMDLSIKAQEHRNDSTKALNEIAEIERRKNTIRQKLNFIQAYVFSISQLKENLNKETSDQFLETLNEVSDRISSFVFAIPETDIDKKNKIKDALSLIQNTFGDFVNNYNNQLDAFYDHVSDSKEKIGKIRNELDEKIKALNESETLLEEVEKKLDVIKKEYEDLNVKVVNPYQMTGAQKERHQLLKKELIDKLEDSKKHKEKITELKKAVKELNESLDKAMKGNPKDGIHTMEAIYAFGKAYNEFQEKVRKQLGLVNQTIPITVSPPPPVIQSAIDDQESDPVMETYESEETNEQSNKFVEYKSNVITPFVLTGLDVMYEMTGRKQGIGSSIPKDKRNDDGTLVFNTNLKDADWFEFTEQQADNRDLNKYDYRIISIHNATPEMLNAIDESIAVSNVSQKDREEALFLFVFDKTGKPQKTKSGRFIFTQFRKDTSNALTKGYWVMKEENREKLSNITDSYQRDIEKKRIMAEEYQEWRMDVLEKTKQKDSIITIRVEDDYYSGGFPNNIKVGKDYQAVPVSSVSKIAKFEVFVNNNKTGEVTVNGITYPMRQGSVYLKTKSFPLIVGRNKLNNDQVETVIALYAEINNKPLSHSINGNPILTLKNGNSGLINKIINHGKSKNPQGKSIYIEKGFLVYGENTDLSNISLSLLEKYTKDKSSLTDKENAEIDKLKDYLKDQHINIDSKSLSLSSAKIPILENGKIKIVNKNYQKYLKEKVLVTSLSPDAKRTFVQINFQVDPKSVRINGEVPVIKENVSETKTPVVSAESTEQDSVLEEKELKEQASAAQEEEIIEIVPMSFGTKPSKSETNEIENLGLKVEDADSAPSLNISTDNLNLFDDLLAEPTPLSTTPLTTPVPATIPTDIEQQKTDIERRRQKELEGTPVVIILAKNNPDGPNETLYMDSDESDLLEARIEKVIANGIKDRQNRIEIIERIRATGVVIKFGVETVALNAFIQDRIDGKTSATFKEFRQDPKSVVNAKYDAELTALEGKPVAPVTPAAPVAEPSVPETKPVAQQPKQQEEVIIEQMPTDGKLFYFASPDSQGRFPASWGSNQFDESKSIFEFIVKGEEAFFRIAPTERSQRLAQSTVDGMTKESYEKFMIEPKNKRGFHSGIQSTTIGKAILKDGYWVVTKKTETVYATGVIRNKIINLDEAKSILKNLQESDQVTKKCD